MRQTAAALVAIAATGAVLVPVLAMVWTLWTEGSGQLSLILTSPGLGSAVENTLLLAIIVTLVAVPLGTSLALTLRRPDLPGRAFWRIAILLPVVIPDFVLSFSWLLAYGRAGFTDALLGLTWTNIQSPVGVAVVVVVNEVPLSYLIIAVGLAARAEPAAERAARVSGASPWTVLRTITLPLLRPAMLTAAALVFVLTLGTFAIPQVMGSPGGFFTVTTRIYAYLARSSDPEEFLAAIALALLLVIMAALVIAPTDMLLGPRLRVTRVATTDPVIGAGGRRAASRWLAVGIATYLLLAVALPALALLATAVTRAVGLPPTPQNWTLANFAGVLTARNETAFSRSLLLAAGAASLLVLMGGCVAALERGRGGRIVATLVTLTLVLPGSTLAVGLLIAYGRWLGGTLTLILLAYLAKLWAVAHRPISGAIDRLPPDELHAARVSGASTLTAIRTVVLRPLVPALVAAWFVCFLTALHEVTMSSLLYGPGSETLAVAVLNSEELGQLGGTAALSVLLTVVLLLPALLGRFLVRQLATSHREPQLAAEPARVR